MMRSGRMRRELINELALLHGALAFDVGRPRFQANHVFLVELQFGRVFDGDDSFAVGNVRRQAHSRNVVLPAPVPPEIRMFNRAFTQPCKQFQHRAV